MAADTTGLSLREHLEQLGELLRAALDYRVDIVVDVAPGCPDVAVAGQPLRAALVELVANARDAMPDGGRLMLRAGRCRATTRAVRPRGMDELGDWVAVSVADTGNGMSTEQRERATDAGYSTKVRPRGGGCGLTRTVGFARGAGGTLSICSAPGAGTVVTLYLPRAQ
jgi:signal transduction histidine kinase